MNAKRLMVMACAVALSTVGLVEGVAAAQAPGSDRFHPMGAEQSRALGIQMIAKSFGITPEAAASRMNVEEHASDLVERIRNQYADRLAGIYIEHEPTHRLVVRLTGSSPVQSEFYQFDNSHAGSDQLMVDYQVGAEHTFADLQKRFEGGFAGLKSRLPALQGGYVDERTGQIVLEVVADKKTAASLAVSQRQLADNLFGASTRIVPMGRIINQAIQGSGDLSFVQATLGGGVNLTCTGAFTVSDNSTPTKYGLLTAGHCQASSGSYSYKEAVTGTPTATLTHVARRFDADTDVGWAMISTTAADATNSFYAGSAWGGWQTQGPYLSKSGTTTGWTMCHYGTITTTGSCGTVASTAYNPGSICGTGLGIYTGTSACNAVYVAVDSVACAPSDSGGPWFYITAAGIYRPAGVHKAGNTSSGRCVYSSVDDIFGSPLNLQIL